MLFQFYDSNEGKEEPAIRWVSGGAGEGGECREATEDAGVG